MTKKPNREALSVLNKVREDLKKGHVPRKKSEMDEEYQSRRARILMKVRGLKLVK